MEEAGYKFAYFGYTDEETEGEWIWATGAKKGYENWREEDLDNFMEEDYGMLWLQCPYYWNDGGLRESDGYFICEWILEDGSSWEQPALTATPATATSLMALLLLRSKISLRRFLLQETAFNS